MIKLVILDMDGTMFDTEPLWEKAFLKTGNELGYELTKELHDKTIGTTYDSLVSILKTELGSDFPFEKFKEMYIKNYEITVEENGITLKPGINELLKYLKENNYLISLASSSKKRQIKRNLELSNIDENIFDIIISGEEVINGKPNPEIFIRVCEKLNVRPNEALVIEDSNNGIKAAYDAGCISVLIPDKDKINSETISLVNYSFNSLIDIIDLLKQCEV